MVKRTVKLKITSTSRKTMTVLGQRLSARCPLCEREVEILSGAQAAGVLEVDCQTFDHLLAGGQIHAIPTVSGSIRVCKDSLFLK